jgi:hypothetical protein
VRQLARVGLSAEIVESGRITPAVVRSRWNVRCFYAVGLVLGLAESTARPQVEDYMDASGVGST